MTRYPPNRRSPAVVEVHHDLADAVDRILTSMEAGLPLAQARANLLDKLQEAACLIELDRIRRGVA